jgi:hypothetical protein
MERLRSASRSSWGLSKRPIEVQDTPRSRIYSHLTDNKNILDKIGAERPAEQ